MVFEEYCKMVCSDFMLNMYVKCVGRKSSDYDCWNYCIRLNGVPDLDPRASTCLAVLGKASKLDMAMAKSY
jgi:hypothetical protein